MLDISKALDTVKRHSDLCDRRADELQLMRDVTLKKHEKLQVRIKS